MPDPVGNAGYLVGELQQNTPALNEEGGRTDKWLTLRSVYLTRVTTATSFAGKGRQYVATNIEIFRMRWPYNQSQPDPVTMRLKIGTAIYAIRGVRTDTNDRHYTLLDCEHAINEVTQ